jgi:hypothetical protein
VNEMEPRKHAGAAALGRRGGRKRAQNLSAEERRKQARKAVLARWAKITGFDRTRARAAIARVRERAPGGGPFDWDAVKRDRDQGRP